MEDRTITKSMIIELIESLHSELTRITETSEQEIDDRFIICKTYRGKPRFYAKGADGKEQYLMADQKDLIAKLARRRYNEKTRKVAVQEMKQLEKCLSILRNEKNGLADISRVSDGFPEPLKKYITLDSMSDDEYSARWQEENVVVKSKRIHAEDNYHKFKTMRGDYVGSKSEAIIADRLFANGIPYHYEVAFIPEAKADLASPVYDEYGRIIGYEALGFDPFERDTLHPDFYVLNKRTRKAYFWEHLGRLQDPKYCTDNLNRLVRIIDAGYRIGEEILITHEDSNNPLRLESIDEIISRYLK